MPRYHDPLNDPAPSAFSSHIQRGLQDLRTRIPSHFSTPAIQAVIEGATAPGMQAMAILEATLVHEQNALADSAAWSRLIEKIRNAFRVFQPALLDLVQHEHLNPQDTRIRKIEAFIEEDPAAKVMDGARIADLIKQALQLYTEGIFAPLVRAQEEDRHTPYTVPLSDPRVYLALLDMDSDKAPNSPPTPPTYWEFGIETASPTLDVLLKRLSVSTHDEPAFQIVEAILLPAGPDDEEKTQRQSDLCNIAVRSRDGIEQFDLHSLSGTNLSAEETLFGCEIPDHPAGPIIREQWVRIQVLRSLPLSLLDRVPPDPPQRSLPPVS